VPNYNHAKYLDQRLTSVFEQTFKDFEVIILDDCSTDDSVAVIEPYLKDARVSHFIVNQENSGSPFKQWKKGIDLAQGKYIWIAESDDWARVDFLETLLPKLGEGHDFAYCRSVSYNQEDGKTDNAFWADDLEPGRWLKDFSNDGLEEIKNYLVYKNTVPNASACLFDKEKVSFSEAVLSMKFTGDWVFWIDLFAKSSIYFCAKELNTFRYSSSATRAQKNNLLEGQRRQEYFFSINYACKVGMREQPVDLKKIPWIIPMIIYPSVKQLIPTPPINIGRLKYFGLYYSNLFSYFKRRF